MPVIRCYVDDRTLQVLERLAAVRGDTVEALAEAAIENAAIAELPGGYPCSGQYFPNSRAGRDDPALGRESTLRPGFCEGDIA